MSHTMITLIGNATADPELRFTASGAAVTTLSVASTPRTFDRTTGEWKDGATLFMRCNIWRDAAENAAESITKGTRVMVSGRMRQNNYETRDGERRSVIELDVDEIAVSLRFATAKVTRTTGKTGSTPTDASTAGEDPWASAGQPAPAFAGAGAAAPPF